MFLLASGLAIALVVTILLARQPNAKSMDNKGGLIALPKPHRKGEMSLEEAIVSRRSRRSYRSDPLDLGQVGQLLWAGQGITGKEGWGRAAPSAGATYPAHLLIVVGQGGVKGIDAGVYEYIPEDHSLRMLFLGDVRGRLAHAALNQDFIAESPVDIVIVMEYDRTTRVYGQRGIRYVDIEAGHIGQNLYLQAEALGLGTVIVGAFVDDDVSSVLRLKEGFSPLAIMPFGYPQ